MGKHVCILNEILLNNSAQLTWKLFQLKYRQFVITFYLLPKTCPHYLSEDMFFFFWKTNLLHHQCNFPHCITFKCSMVRKSRLLLCLDVTHAFGVFGMLKVDWIMSNPNQSHQHIMLLMLVGWLHADVQYSRVTSFVRGWSEVVRCDRGYNVRRRVSYTRIITKAQ